MIPKILHCCWFGNNPIPNDLKKYIDTWKINCPDYTIKLWSEKNFDVNSHPFTKLAYQQKKYAFVSDYVRAYALFHEGGIYLDTDVEIKLNLDCFLNNEGFSGFETIGMPFTAVWGAIPKHSLPRKVLSYYDKHDFKKNMEPNTLFISELIIKDFGINPQLNDLQSGFDGEYKLTIYPSEFFCLDLYPNFTTHHFFGSWLQTKNIPYKDHVHTTYHLDQILKKSSTNNESLLRNLAKKTGYKDILKILLYKIYYFFKRIKDKG